MPGVLVAVLFVTILFIAGNGPSHGQEPDATGEATQALEPTNAAGQAAAEPVVTRAGAHDDFGRIVFDWPRAVAYGARIEEKTLTVMFDRHLKTTFQEIPRTLGAYVTAVDLGPDGHSVVAALTGDYRLRTFILGSHSPGVRIVVDLLAGAEPMAMDDGAATQFAQLVQADPPLPEPTPEAVPEAMPVDVPPLEAQAASENTPPDTPPVGADPSPEPMPEITTEVVPEITPEDMPVPIPAAAPPAQAEAAPEPTPETVPEDTPPLKADADVPPAEAEAAPEAVPVDAPAPPAETEAAPVAAPVDVPPVATDPSPEPTPEVVPPKPCPWLFLLLRPRHKPRQLPKPCL